MWSGSPSGWTGRLRSSIENLRAKTADINLVIDTVERMAAQGWSLGHPTDEPGIRYLAVPPLGASYRVHGRRLLVTEVVDPRRFRRPIGSGNPYEPPSLL